VIRLDYRTGSWELARLFEPFGIRPQRSKLDYGDADFVGHGPNGECAVVVERKTIHDLVASMQSKRLSGHQLPGMAEQYDYCYLIVEGIWRPGEDGELEINNGTWSRNHGRGIHYRAVDAYLTTLGLLAGVVYRRTASPRESVWQIVDLYRWWTDKEWAKHKAHDTVYAPADGQQGRRMSLVPRRVSLVEKVALQLPGLDQRAREVAKKFGSVREMVLATEKDWLIKGAVGKVGAKKIVEALNGNH